MAGYCTLILVPFLTAWPTNVDPLMRRLRGRRVQKCCRTTGLPSFCCAGYHLGVGLAFVHGLEEILGMPTGSLALRCSSGDLVWSLCWGLVATAAMALDWMLTGSLPPCWGPRDSTWFRLLCGSAGVTCLLRLAPWLLKIAADRARIRLYFVLYPV